MFDQLFERPFTVARYRQGPMLEERIVFLTHLANEGYPRRTLRRFAHYLLLIADTLGLVRPPRKPLILAAVKRKMANQRRYHSLYPLAVPMASVRGVFTGATRSTHSLGKEDEGVR